MFKFWIKHAIPADANILIVIMLTPHRNKYISGCLVKKSKYFKILDLSKGMALKIIPSCQFIYTKKQNP